MDTLTRNHKPTVSVIIPIRRGEDIRETYKSLENSTYLFLQLIVVDEGLERSAQRNIGIQNAYGEYLLILDSDQRVHPDLIEECVYLMTDSNIQGIYIPEILKTKGFFARIRDWERQFYTGTPIDVVRFVRSPCPLFDERMSGPEDSDWDRRIKGKKETSFFPIYHYEKVGLIGYFKKKAYYAKSMKRFIEKHPNDKILDWKWRCWGVFMERWQTFFSNPFMAVLVMLLLLVRGVIYKWVRNAS